MEFYSSSELGKRKVFQLKRSPVKDRGGKEINESATNKAQDYRAFSARTRKKRAPVCWALGGTDLFDKFKQRILQLFKSGNK